jgi:uncharacterized membrane protein
MRTVTANESCHASVHEAQTAWCDTSRWTAWVDGLSEVTKVSADWPQEGSHVHWETGPAGRGDVTERVVRYEPLAMIEFDVTDDSIRGQQTVYFTPLDDGVEIYLSLSYEITQRNPFMPVIDLLFVRRAMERSLRATLQRFAAHVEATAAEPPA